MGEWLWTKLIFSHCLRTKVPILGQMKDSVAFSEVFSRSLNEVT